MGSKSSRNKGTKSSKPMTLFEQLAAGRDPKKLEDREPIPTPTPCSARKPTISAKPIGASPHDLHRSCIDSVRASTIETVQPLEKCRSITMDAFSESEPECEPPSEETPAEAAPTETQAERRARIMAAQREAMWGSRASEDHSDKPKAIPEPQDKSDNSENSSDDTEPPRNETRAERRARILAAQKAAMWGSDASEDDSDKSSDKSDDTENSSDNSEKEQFCDPAVSEDPEEASIVSEEKPTQAPEESEHASVVSAPEEPVMAPKESEESAQASVESENASVAEEAPLENSEPVSKPSQSSHRDSKVSNASEESCHSRASDEPDRASELPVHLDKSPPPAPVVDELVTPQQFNTLEDCLIGTPRGTEEPDEARISTLSMMSEDPEYDMARPTKSACVMEEGTTDVKWARRKQTTIYKCQAVSALSSSKHVPKVNFGATKRPARRKAYGMAGPAVGTYNPKRVQKSSHAPKIHKSKTKRKCFTGKCRGMRSAAPGPGSYNVRGQFLQRGLFAGTSKQKRVKGGAWSTTSRFGNTKPVHGMSSHGPGKYNIRKPLPAVAKGAAWSRSKTRRPCTPNPRTKTPKRKPRRKEMNVSKYGFASHTSSSARKEAHARRKRSTLAGQRSRTAPKVTRPTWTRKAGSTRKVRKVRARTTPKPAKAERPSKSCLKKTRCKKRGAFTGTTRRPQKPKASKKVAFSEATVVVPITAKSLKRSTKPEPEPVKEATPELPPVDRMDSIEDMSFPEETRSPTPPPQLLEPIPRASTPPPEAIQAVLERISTMTGYECDESEPPAPIPVKKSPPQSSNDDEEETRSQRRARALEAQRAAMWSDEESDAKDAKSEARIYSDDPDLAERIGAIQKRIDQLHALLDSCPKANREFVNGHIVTLEAEVAVLRGSASNGPAKESPTEESDAEESEAAHCSEEEKSESGSEAEWGSDMDEISDLSDIQALIAHHGL